VSPIEWSPCSPRTIQPPLTASPCNRLSRSRSTISQSDFHPIIRPFSPYRFVRSYTQDKQLGPGYRLPRAGPALLALTDITFRFGAGAQNANVFIPFDAAYQHTMQAGRVCTESESDPSKMLPDTHQADQK
jgi:hypothetical protein